MIFQCEQQGDKITGRYLEDREELSLLEDSVGDGGQGPVAGEVPYPEHVDAPHRDVVKTRPQLLLVAGDHPMCGHPGPLEAGAQPGGDAVGVGQRLVAAGPDGAHHPAPAPGPAISLLAHNTERVLLGLEVSLLFFVYTMLKFIHFWLFMYIFLRRPFQLITHQGKCCKCILRFGFLTLTLRTNWAPC